MNKQFIIRNFGVLLRRDFKTLIPAYKEAVINAFVWAFITIGIKVYVLPYFGVEASYGSLVLAAAIISIANFEIVNQAMILAYDIHGQRIISYDLTIPLPPSLVFIERGLCFALYAMLVSFTILPIGKLLFWNHIDLAYMSLMHYTLIFVFSHIMLGMFSIWLISYISHVQKMGTVWVRIVFPLWFLGGLEFSWISAYKTLGNWAYLLILNPYTYPMEGIKASLLVPAEYLPFWLCMGMTILFGMLFAWVGVKVLKRRLDVL